MWSAEIFMSPRGLGYIKKKKNEYSTFLSSACIIWQIKTQVIVFPLFPFFVLACANKGRGCCDAVEAELYDGNEAARHVRSAQAGSEEQVITSK